MQSLRFLKEYFVSMKLEAETYSFQEAFALCLIEGKNIRGGKIRYDNVYWSGSRKVHILAASSWHPPTFGIFADILLSWERGKEAVKKNICTALFQLSVIRGTKARCSPFRQFSDCSSKWALSKQKHTIIPIKLFLGYTIQLPSLIWKMN